MRALLPTAVLVCLALSGVPGCQLADQAVSTTPSRAELPTFAEELEPRLAIGVAVEGARDDRGILIVPKYEKIEPTPEEREILGEEPELEIDALALYRPPRGPEHGVSTESFQARTGVGGIGGVSVDLDLAPPRYGTSGFAGRAFGIDVLKRWVAGAGGVRQSGAEAGQLRAKTVGECEARRPAQRAHRNYR
jgi:hypothetical protein